MISGMQRANGNPPAWIDNKIWSVLVERGCLVSFNKSKTTVSVYCRVYDFATGKMFEMRSSDHSGYAGGADRINLTCGKRNNVARAYAKLIKLLEA